MSISKAAANLRRKRIAGLYLWAVWGLMVADAASACSCAWKGAFLTVARDAPLVIIGKVLRHHPGSSPTMDVEVLELLKGGLLDSGLTVQMGDGMHCRPTMDLFPIGSTWVLAMNGQGSKPGSGWAISNCGEYRLKVEGDEVIGSLDGDANHVKRMPLGEFKNRWIYPRFSQQFSGRVEAGREFRRAFGQRFEFVLRPRPDGWDVVIRELGRDENLARLTPPFHGMPNPREIEGWHFLKNPSECRHRPYNADSGPDNPRQFIFSPEVGKTIGGPDSRRTFLDEDIGSVERFGRGELHIEKFKLAPGEDGCPKIEWLEFSVKVEGGY